MSKGFSSTNEQQGGLMYAFSAHAVAGKPPRGFTLVETLVAITVLLLVVIGPMTVAQRGIQNAYFAAEQATAVFLAQEAIEAVRELRDGAALVAFDTDGGGNTSGWASSLPAECSSGCAYVGGGQFGTCAGNNACRLKVDSTTEKYNHQTGADSPFTRTVIINESGGNAEVAVTVSWEGHIFGGGTREVVLQTWIYDHYERYEN